MTTEIYYFSGTGNSLVVAQDIAEKTNGKLVPIASVMSEENIKTDAESMGVVFPVYHSVVNGVPLIIQRFAKKLENTDSKYIFAVCTCGGWSGATIENLQNIIKSKGGKLAAGFTVQMPDNTKSIPEKKQEEMFNNWNNQLETISEYVNAQKTGKFETMGLPIKILAAPYFSYLKSKTYKMLEELLNTSDMSFEELVLSTDLSYYADDNCEGCGTCSRVCPVHNINIVEEKPEWQHHCEQCFACFNWCPRSAIHGAWISDEIRYHHPDIRVKDMLSQTSFKD
ncbi:MAG: Coenzyme F420 hydrogenase subunit gamma [Methanobacterium sp. PtaB.Bin024]|nr:MAG: Coenzyme F420 hydrogenase subunit gamma [Methanobacterium sp. PtaB.Bin024]